MAKHVRVRIVLDVSLDDPGAVSETACSLYAAMESQVPGTGGLTASLERSLRELPGLALQSLINPRQLVEDLPGVTLVRAETIVEPHGP